MILQISRGYACSALAGIIPANHTLGMPLVTLSRVKINTQIAVSTRTIAELKVWGECYHLASNIQV